MRRLNFSLLTQTRVDGLIQDEVSRVLVVYADLSISLSGAGYHRGRVVRVAFSSTSILGRPHRHLFPHEQPLDEFFHVGVGRLTIFVPGGSAFLLLLFIGT